MRTKILYIMLICFSISIDQAIAQVKYKIENGLIYIGSGTFAPNENKYSALTDSLDHNLKSNPNDTTSLFFRSLLYLRYNSLIANPNLNDDRAAGRLRLAITMADKADSLKMRSFYLIVLRAQICKELSTRYAPIETWRFNNRQLIDRKKEYEYYKNLANKIYDELSILDKNNSYDYKKLKVK